MKRYLVIAALAACGNKGAATEKATPETEAFIELLNTITANVEDIDSRFGLAGPDDRCHYYGEAIGLLGDLRTKVLAMPLRNHAPGLGTCVDAIRSDVQSLDIVLSKDTGQITAANDLCRELGILWADRSKPLADAECKLKKTYVDCIAAAKAAGATTEIDEPSFCYDVGSTAGSEEAPAAPAPGVPTKEPRPPAPAAPPPPP